MKINIIDTHPFLDQKPGTSGLRKKVRVFQQPHYLENYLQAIFDTLSISAKTLLVGGDGRYFNREAIQTVIKMAAANGVKTLWVAKDGLLSTPAASLLIRKYKIFAGLILSASHNPAGVDGDFGVKLNLSEGGAAPESITEAIYASSQGLTQYQIIECQEIDIVQEGETLLGAMTIKVIDSIEDYALLMESLFDFTAIRQWFSHGHTFCFDAMHAVSGPYAKTIFIDKLGANAGSVMNANPCEDFGGGHPDPNPIYAKNLMAKMAAYDAPDLGAASDGDADRHMIVGKGGLVVSPSDSLAILVANAHYIPAYRGGLAGVARSMPTAGAVDRVALALGIPLYETPTGWKFFSSLLEAGRITLCGEESYSAGSDHIREKDGIWAILYWLNIVATTNQTVEEVVQAHWARFGRHYYTRHDFEEIPVSKANAVMQYLRTRIQTLTAHVLPNFHMSDDFSYIDPVSGEGVDNQGIRIVFNDGSRIIYRLSGTGTEGATLRVYVERYIEDTFAIHHASSEVLADLVEISRDLADLERLIGSNMPTLVI